MDLFYTMDGMEYIVPATKYFAGFMQQWKEKDLVSCYTVNNFEKLNKHNKCCFFGRCYARVQRTRDPFKKKKTKGQGHLMRDWNRLTRIGV